MNQNFITFFSMKKLKNKTENTIAAEFKSILTTSQNAAVVADTNMRLAFLKDN